MPTALHACYVKTRWFICGIVLAVVVTAFGVFAAGTTAETSVTIQTWIYTADSRVKTLALPTTILSLALEVQQVGASDVTRTVNKLSPGQAVTLSATVLRGFSYTFIIKAYASTDGTGTVLYEGFTTTAVSVVPVALKIVLGLPDKVAGNPTVVSTTPVNGSTSVSITQTISATFSESMSAASLTSSTATLQEGGTTHTAIVFYNDITKTVTVAPVASLVSGLAYTATLTTGVTDLAGHPLSNPVIWQFSTLAVATEQAKLTAADAAAEDQFGISVAIDDDTFVVGAYGNDDAGSSSGSAYVFVRSGTTWAQEVKLIASDAASQDQFGFSVDVSGDTALVGANGDDSACPSVLGPSTPISMNCGSGAAYVFVRSGTAWSEQAKLTSSDLAAGDSFGSALALDGNTAVVGAQGDDDSGMSSGSAYVFARAGTTWSQQAKLTATDPGIGDSFGLSVALDGDTALVGENGDVDGGNINGAVYVFVRSGTTWTQQAKLTATDGVAQDQFGISVALSGETAVVGASGDDDSGRNSGSAYVFLRSGTTWSQQASLRASDAAPADGFGGAVTLNGDTAVVGAKMDDGSVRDSGSAYVFLRSGTAWTLQKKLIATDAGLDVRLGRSLATSGGAIVIGPGMAGSSSDDGGTPSSGSVYVFSP